MTKELKRISDKKLQDGCDGYYDRYGWIAEGAANEQFQDDKQVLDNAIKQFLDVTDGIHSNTCQARDGYDCDCRIGDYRQALKKKWGVK